MYSSHYLPDTLIPSKRQEFISSAKELLARFSTPPVLLSTGLSGISLAAPLQQHLHTYLGIDCPLMYIRDPHTKTIAHGSKVEYSARLDMRPDHLLLVDDIVSSGTTLENTLRTIYEQEFLDQFKYLSILVADFYHQPEYLTTDINVFTTIINILKTYQLPLRYIGDKNSIMAFEYQDSIPALVSETLTRHRLNKQQPFKQLSLF